MYLWNALERVRIVIAEIGLSVLGYKLSHDLSYCALPCVHAHAMDALVEGAWLALHAEEGKSTDR